MTTLAPLVDAILALGLAVAAGSQLVRWWRVLQREHYEARSVLRFYRRWALPEVPTAAAARRWPTRPVPLTPVCLAAVVACYVARLDEWAVGVIILHGLFFPRGLGPRGRTGALAWTRRLRLVAVVSVVLVGIVAGVAAFIDRPWVAAGLAVALVAPMVALAAALLAPVEERLAGRYVREATARLVEVRPRIVAITGSFGKTSTKHHLAELLGARHGVVPSPRSFNNRAGLSRAINENLAPGTRVFIAEMGTYGPGEIRSLCDWCPPEIAVVTAIGPVHLERMRNLEVIERAKHEITERATAVVLNGDDPRLAGWVEPLRAEGKLVMTAGSVGGDLDVRVTNDVDRWYIYVDGALVATAPPVAGVREENLACAIAAAMLLGTPVEEIVGRLGHLTSVASRMVVATAPSGVMVIDDTFNANPAGARAALATLMSLPISGRRVVVTPGMVELGPLQRRENEALGREVAAAGAELVVVGRTNAASLTAGYGPGAARVDVREQAVGRVRATLHAGDGVLYLNDLPDHYP